MLKHVKMLQNITTIFYMKNTEDIILIKIYPEVFIFWVLMSLIILFNENRVIMKNKKKRKL